jgi:hypothetical protein
MFIPKKGKRVVIQDLICKPVIVRNSIVPIAMNITEKSVQSLNEHFNTMLKGKIPDFGYKKMNMIEFEQTKGWDRILDAITTNPKLEICSNAVQYLLK